MIESSSEETLNSDNRKKDEKGRSLAGQTVECFKCGKQGHFKKDCKEPETKREEVSKTVPFTCSVCGQSEKCHYLGTEPPFCKAFIQFHEQCFVIIDPFTPRQFRGVSNFLVLGGFCSYCKEEVCVECSIYFTKRFCIKCSQFNINEFPKEVQGKIVKKVATDSSSK